MKAWVCYIIPFIPAILLGGAMAVAYYNTDTADDTCQWDFVFVYEGTITDWKWYPNPYTEDNPLKYYFEIDNTTWVQVTAIDDARWDVGDHFVYFSDEIITVLPWEETS